MKSSLCLILIVFPLFLNAQGTKIDRPPDWENPAIFEIGQNAPHAFHIPFLSTEDALNNNADKTFMLLNGLWKFKWVERPDLVPEGFYEAKFNTKKWDEIPVPANWQMQGYGHPKFRNIALSFENDPPRIPDYYNPTGCYKRTFTLPNDWLEKEVMLRFEGVRSASTVWINGEKVGYNQGAFEPAEYNITPYIKKGKNDISVEVIRFSDGSYLENQDMWRLSGIFRDVILYAQSKVHIADFYQTTDLDEACENATLYIELDIANASESKTSGYNVEVDVVDAEGRSILSVVPSQSVAFTAAGLQKVKLSTVVDNPLKWSAEHPNLYNIIYTLKNTEGETIEVFTKKIGFREVELNGEVLTVNGVPVKLNGVNSHMHHPEHGQAVPYETLKKDLLIMKQFNINNVRTCHYPPSPEYLDLADELGLYIIDEVGDEAHNNIQLSYDPTFTEMYRDRSRKIVYRDRNHPSVIIWSAGNEAGSGPNIDEVIKTGKAIDPSRPAWMYGGNTFYIPFEDITGPRYWIPYQLKNLAERKILGEEDLRPSYMDEYLAATGNGLGGLDEYWELIWRYPKLMGGAIWDWISPGLTTPLWITPDQSGLKNDGAIMGRPTFVNGENGRALSFSGHDDWVEFYRDPSLDITGDMLSISFDIKPSEIPQKNTFITKGTHQYGIIMNSGSSLEFYIQSNNLAEILQSPYYENTSERISAIAPVPEDWYDNWHHVLGSYDGKFLRLFIDGEELAKTAHSGKIAHSPFPLCIGRDAELHDQGEFSGRLSSMIIDDVKIFDAALSPNEIKAGKLQLKPLLDIDFEKDTKDGYFYAVGLGGRTYGIIWPDREIQPEIYQIKKAGQPIAVEALDPGKGLFRVINRHMFTNLDEFDMAWEIAVDGRNIENGMKEISLEPQANKIIELLLPEIHEKGEAILTISFRRKEKSNWAEAGHEVAWEQFVITKEAVTIPLPESGAVSLIENDESISVTGANFNYTIDRKNGQFTSMVFNGKSYIEDGPCFNIWQAPTANTIDPWGSYQFGEDKKTDGLGRSIDNQLRTLGMRNLAVQVDVIEVYKPDNSKAIISILKYWNSSNMRGSFECKEEYTILSDGTIQIDFEVDPHGNMPDMLPKLGWQFYLPKSFSKIDWYGRGPFETYPDRKTGAKIGRYTSSADQEYVPYIIPQEYGNHTDTRWLILEDQDGSGFQIKGDELFNFSLHKFSTENLSRAMYTYQLKEAPHLTLNIDPMVSGVGGTAIRQLQQYRVPAASRKFSMSIKPF